MKTSNITKSALALALGLCASGAWAATTTPVDENFQGAAFNNGNTNTVAGITANNLTWADTDGYTAVESGVLVVDAADNPTTAAIANDAKTKFDSAVTGNRTATFSADVAFTPSKTLLGSSDIADGGNLKFALFAYDDGTSTNLYYYTSGTAVNTSIPVTENALHSLVINFSDDNGTRKFSVSYNGSSEAGPYAFANNAEVGQIDFSGNGSVDNIALAYALVDTTITWPTTLSVVSYTVDGEPGDVLTASAGTYTVSTEPGAAIVITGTTPYGATVTASGTAGTGFGVTTTTSDIGWYFPQTATAGQNGSAEHPFEIADEGDLQALKGLVGVTNCSGIAFVQTASFALTSAWAGIGPDAGKDLVNGDNKDIPRYEREAFSGIYDGGNHTISNFQMVNGCDYGALFNSVNNATIKNLKISWGANKLCANSSATGGDTGASFVGTARFSTLTNLTALATQDVDTVSASKDMAGIVGYLTAGSTVVDCENQLNVGSLLTAKARKSGGIALITQDGTGTATIKNCRNSGNVSLANAGGFKGGIVGYIGVATKIVDCENTAAVQLFHFQDGSISVSGTNKGNATVASNDKSGGVSGLYFATVSGDVATFVADNALELNGEYKVMSAGATATFAFAEAGTIAFDTALFTPTYAITAPGLVLSDSTSGTVTTYTARNYAVVNVSVTGGANATASWTVNDAASAQPTTITEGQSWAVTLTADSGYEFNGSNTTTLSGTAGAADFTIELPNATPVTVTVTVTGGANATAAWTVGESSAQPTTLTYGQAWSVTLTADTGYEFNGSNTTTLSGTAGTTDFTIALPDATAIPPAEYGTTEGKDTAIDIKSGEGSTSHTLTTTEATYLNELVTAKGGTAAAQADIEAAVAQLTEKEFTDAVLLNQDVTDTTNAGSYEFKVSKISKNSSGVTVTVTLTRDGTPRGGIKGQLVLQTSETPNGTYADAAEQTISESSFGTDASPASAKFTFTGSYKFFKVVIR